MSELIGAELGERPIVGVVDGGQLVALIGERDARGAEVLGHLLVAVEHPRPGRSARVLERGDGRLDLVPVLESPASAATRAPNRRLRDPPPAA